MAVIARSLCAFLLAGVAAQAAESTSTPLQVVNRVATALADNDAAEAIRPFGPSFDQRETLRAYFDNLTSSYQISCEADIVDEQDTPAAVDLTLDWSLTLQNRSSDATVHRRDKVHVTLHQVKGEWTIVAFSPLALFTPQM